VFIDKKETIHVPENGAVDTEIDKGFSRFYFSVNYWIIFWRDGKQKRKHTNFADFSVRFIVTISNNPLSRYIYIFVTMT
jgi:hypothetical protein